MVLVEGGSPPYFTNIDAGLGQFWHPVAFSDEVPADQPTAVTLLGTAWMVVRTDGGLHAYLDECPHRRAPLSRGQLVDGELQCRYHGWRFSLDGSCVSIPTLDPSAPLPSRSRLQGAFAVEDRYGLVWIAPQRPQTAVLDWPEWQADGWDSWYLDRRVTSVSAGLLMENFLDATHFRHIHAATFGANAHSVGPDVQERVGWSLHTGYQHDSQVEDQKTIPATVDGFLRGPFSLRIHIAGPTNTRIYTFFLQPCTRTSTRLYLGLSCNDTHGDGQRHQEVSDFNNRVYDEDLDLLEAFVHPELPVDLRAEVHTKADIIAYRRILADVAGLAAMTTDEGE